MLDNVAGYSVDKVKFWLELDSRGFAEKLKAWEAVFGDLLGPQRGKVYNVASLKRSEHEGFFWYAFDVWGEAAARVDELDFAAWYPYLDRMDLKVLMPMTESGRDNYRDYLKEKLNGNRTIRLMDSPQRQKRGTRDSGGHSLALGSHKSDYRAHWTLRGSETGYQEFQLEGTRLQGAIAATSHWLRNGGGPDGRTTWQGLCRAILTDAQIELSDLDGLRDSERGAILAGDITGHGIIERKLRWLEEDIEKLPRDAVYGLYQALELKLFGEPPAHRHDAGITQEMIDTADEGE